MPEPGQVYAALQDVGLGLEQLLVRSVVPTEGGASVLLALGTGTLVSAELVRVYGGWTLRNLYLVAGSPGPFRSWSAPWRRRVEDAERFLAAAGEGGQQRRPQELAPLIWFEDPEESARLWGLNPLTYRLMQALRVLPLGPMDSRRGTGPRGRS